MKTDSVIIILVSFLLSMFSSQQLGAQNVIPEGYHMVDSIVYRPAAAVDSTLAGKDIFRIMPSKSRGASVDVTVSQSSAVAGSMASHMAANAQRTISGYRVRIFFDNRQTARSESEAALKKFERLYHDVTAYRSYANPYFKVTVGDFRTKSEAMALLERIKYEFPSAFVVKENISYPIVDVNNAYVIDTVKVLRPVTVQ